MDISKFSTFFSFPRHISRPKVCISHFRWYSVLSPYSRSFSVHFSFITFFSDFVIFQVVKWKFLISMIFSFLAIFPVLQWTFLNFPPFSVFLAIFHVLKYVFLILCDFHFCRHIPGPTVCISHFSRFSLISSLFKSSSVCFWYSVICSFLAIFHGLQWTFLIFQLFQFSSPYFTS